MSTQYYHSVCNILNELFDTKYAITSIQGTTSDNRTLAFKDFDVLLAYHIKRKSSTPITLIKCCFVNKSGETIETMLYPSVPQHTILDDEPVLLVVSFHLKDNIGKIMTHAYDASMVVSTTMHIMLDYMRALQKIITHTTNDWDNRTHHGLFQFSVYPNASMNKISKQIRSNKEKVRGYTQREHLYEAAFDHIIKPSYPYLGIHKHLNHFIVKS